MTDSFDPQALAASVVPVDGTEHLAALPRDTDAILLASPTDALLAEVVARLPGLRHLLTDGNGGALTDRGLAHLAGLTALESLDLEWSAVTDAGLPAVAALPALRWVDLGGAAGVTSAGLAALRRERPDLEIEAQGM